MLKKHSSYGSNPSNLHSPQAKDEGEEHTKKQKITWDEVTIAEHDKERGTRYVLKLLMLIILFYQCLIVLFPFLQTKSG